MSWRLLFQQQSGLAHVEEQLIEMLRLDARSFELAHRALFDDGDVERLRREVSDTDHEVNLLVHDVRRQLIVHASVRESLADIPAMFTYMSLVKDVERVGDLAKDIAGLAGTRTLAGRGILEGARGHQKTVAAFLSEVTAVLDARDVEGAKAALSRGAATMQALEQDLRGLVDRDPPGPGAAPLALYHRYLERIVGHLANLLTSLVGSVDQLDYYPSGSA